jgi:hypothetical protein
MPRRKQPNQFGHLHKYERVTLGKSYVVYRCQLPGCAHYIRKELVKGKKCICNRCLQPMILDSFAMQFVKPHCRACTERYETA